MENQNPTLFISYCQKDGNTFADDLETELVDYFNVDRDKTSLDPSDDIYLFMGEIANKDYVIITLTSGYLKSRNCMLEMAYLASQPDWSEKTMVLVIDESIYYTERKIDIINYWKSEQQKATIALYNNCNGIAILEEEKEYLDLINQHLENFLHGISRRLNPSQIKIVNEMVRKTKNLDKRIHPKISEGEQAVKSYLKKHGSKTIAEISNEINCNRVVVYRIVKKLIDSGDIFMETSEKNRLFSIKD